MSTRTDIRGSAAAFRGQSAAPMMVDLANDNPRRPVRGMPAAGVARIYRPGRGVTQSGRARSREWVLDFEPAWPTEIEPLMGWVASRDPMQQVVLRFPDAESAVRFAARQGWPYSLWQPVEGLPKPHRYSENFLAPDDTARPANQPGLTAAA